IGNVERASRVAARLLERRADKDIERFRQGRAIYRSLERLLLPRHPGFRLPLRLLRQVSLDQIGGLPREQIEQTHIAFGRFPRRGRIVRRKYAKYPPRAADKRRGLNGADARRQQHIERGLLLKNGAVRNIFYDDAFMAFESVAACGDAMLYTAEEIEETRIESPVLHDPQRSLGQQLQSALIRPRNLDRRLHDLAEQ